MLALVLPLVLPLTLAAPPKAPKAPAAKTVKAPKAAAAPAPVKEDALDFENGTVLVSASESYSTGVGDWTAWRLTDGSPQGWCSPKEKTKGSTFEWEFEVPWAVETLGVDNSQTEEDGYPGVSAKTLKLEGQDDKGAWRTLGTFVAPQGGKKLFKLPKGPPLTRVKLTVADNYGNAEFTELGELDLFGTRARPVPKTEIAGIYTTTYGPMRFVQEGDQVFGCYDWHDDASYVWGTLEGRTAKVTWYEPGSTRDEDREGSAVFSVAGAGAERRFWGVWYEHGQIAGEWAGPTSDQAPKCQPQKKGQLLRALKAKGRVVLYGIRFDVNSDVPRADSEPTLQELAETIPALGLKVLVEGHTDSTNSAAYNLDLSNRRAQAVVAWLTEHGVKAELLSAEGFGLTRPAADNSTAQGRALNRRVEVSLAH